MKPFKNPKPFVVLDKANDYYLIDGNYFSKLGFSII